MKRILGRLCLLGLLFLAVGCLQFEEQTMSYRYVRESDELRIFQDYRGIFGSGRAIFLNEGEADRTLPENPAELSESVAATYSCTPSMQP